VVVLKRYNGGGRQGGVTPGVLATDRDFATGFPLRESAAAPLTASAAASVFLDAPSPAAPERPGLVLVLDRAGSVRYGLSYRRLAHNATLDYLRAREQVNGVMFEAHVPVTAASDPHNQCWR